MAGPEANQQRHGPDDVLVLLSGRTAGAVRVHARRVAGVPAEAELRAGLRLADLPHLRHLPRECRRIEPGPPDQFSPGYDAEATIAPDGLIVFTSVRDGDMEIYSMKADGIGRQAADESSRARRRAVLLVGRQARGVPRASAAAGPEFDDYKSLLAEGLWRPTSLELYIMDRDGRNLAATDEAWRGEFRAVVAPGRQASGVRVEHRRPQRARLRHLHDQSGRHPVSSGSPSTTRSTASRCSRRTASHLVFASNRNAKVEGETNVFIADWK